MEDVLTQSFLTSMVLSFILGAASSWIFWKYQRFLKPDVRISPMILRGPSRRELGKTIYRIKVANMGKRQVSNIMASATISTLSGECGIDQRRVYLKKLTLNFSDLPALGVKSQLANIWGMAPFFIFSIEDDLESLLDQNSRMIFTISASDALSGTAIVQRIAYTKNDIEYGDFRRSLDFAKSPLVIPTNTENAPVASAQDREVSTT